MHLPNYIISGAVAGMLLILSTACGKKPAPTEGLAPFKFQTDWYAQAEHGGHYQASARGFYKEAGLDVDILVGGPGMNPLQRVALGQADAAMGRSDDIIVAVAEGLPLLIVSALMQRDPQGILVHEESGIDSFAQLNGKAIMAVPGANWVAYLKARHKIEFGIIPINYGLGTFMADKNFIQQCFVTNEPYYARLNGANPRTLLIADSGYNPYRVLYTSKEFAAKHPERLRAFVAASIKGWDDFLKGDASAGKAIIASRNEKMSEEFMTFSINEMNRLELVSGSAERGERTGLITRERISSQIELLKELGILRKPVSVEEVVSFDFLPEDMKRPKEPKAATNTNAVAQ